MHTSDKLSKELYEQAYDKFLFCILIIELEVKLRYAANYPEWNSKDIVDNPQEKLKSIGIVELDSCENKLEKKLVEQLQAIQSLTNSQDIRLQLYEDFAKWVDIRKIRCENYPDSLVVKFLLPVYQRLKENNLSDTVCPQQMESQTDISYKEPLFNDADRKKFKLFISNANPNKEKTELDKIINLYKIINN